MSKGEDELIAWIASRRGGEGASISVDPALLIGPGDDMAMVSSGPGRLLVACDMLMDGVDFDSSKHAPRQMGRKAMAVNLSDCAAMAVRPRWALLSVALPSGWTMSQAQELYAGAEAVAAEFGCQIIGGDTNSWDRPLVVDVTILAEPWDDSGQAAGRRQSRGTIAPIRRNGMRPGDVLFVTGRLGGSLSEHHLTFTPRVHEARALAAILGEHLHAMMDLSDGLSVDAARMAAASGCGVEFDEAALRALATEAAAVMEKSDGRSLTSHVLDDGEDFELFFAVAAQARVEAGMLGSEALSCGVGSVGHAIDEQGVWMRRLDGSRVAVEPRGWRHFQDKDATA